MSELTQRPSEPLEQCVELHRLQLRFAPLRLHEPRAIEQLTRSIEQCGQQVPCIAVCEADPRPGAPEHWVLIDGYRRVAALRRVGSDSAQVAFWPCDAAQALLRVLCGAQGRAHAPLEQALWLRELAGLGLSQRELARRSGRDVSWVSRRLALLSQLSEEVLHAVCAGEVSCWAATRVVSPLARANSAHAQTLLSAAREHGLSTRELRTWFEHYQRATRATRERMVQHPRLFLQALSSDAQQQAQAQLRAGPEGACLADLQRLRGFIQAVRERWRCLGNHTLSPELLQAARATRSQLQALSIELTEVNAHEDSPDPKRRAHSQSTGTQPATDQPNVAAVT